VAAVVVAVVLAFVMKDGVVAALWAALSVAVAVAAVVGGFVWFARCTPSHPSRVVPFLRGDGSAVLEGRRRSEGSRSRPVWDCRDFSAVCCLPRSRRRGRWIGDLRRGRLGGLRQRLVMLVRRIRPFETVSGAGKRRCVGHSARQYLWRRR
jgi:hypothetical protein